ncbi:MAG: hypothetical protein C0623_08035, partial [Desulfuromonas sp.]
VLYNDNTDPVACSGIDTSGWNGGVKDITVDADDCGGAMTQAVDTFTWNSCSLTAPGVPTVSNITATSVDLTWTAATGDTVTSYLVNGVDVGNVLTTTVSSLSGNTGYTFNVAAQSATCTGPTSSVSTATLPAAPTGVTASNPTTSGMAVSWTGVSGTETVTYAISGGATVANATSPEAISGLSPNTTYQFNVTATNSSGSGAASSASAPLYTLAVAPSAPTVNNATGNTLDVIIGADSNPAATEYAIRINGGSFTNQYVQGDGSVGATEAWLTPGAWGAKTVTGLALGTNYSFDVKARNGGSVETAFSTATALSTQNAINETTGASVAATVGDSKISVTANYTGDFPTDNNDAIVEWELCSGACDGSTFSNSSGLLGNDPTGPYTYEITGLTNFSTYQVRITLVDPDGTIPGTGWAAAGSDIEYVVTDLAPTDPMIHNAASTGSTKWGGTWGLPGGQYGQFTCETCHTDTTTNIKRIKGTITAPSGSFPGSTVTFTSAVDGSSDFGDINAAHSTSEGVCEVCHTYDATQANGVKHHGFDMSGASAADRDHFNQLDCLSCHNHKAGFLPTSCDSCHGDPPITNDTDGSTNTGLTHTDVTGSATVGAHDAHVNTLGFNDCNTCHNGYIMPNGGDIDINFNVDFSANGSGTSNTGSYVGQNGVSYNGTVQAAADSLTCDTVYCHGGSIGGTNPTWDGTVACGDCHGATTGTPPTSVSHATHVGSLGLDCSVCHGSGYTAGTVAPADHVDGTVFYDVTSVPNTGSAATYNGQVSASLATLAPANTDASCANVSCHFGTTPNWDTANSTDCASCHNNGAGEPWPSSGAHDAHFTALNVSLSASVDNEATVRAECNICHNGTAATHADTNKDVAFGATYDDQSAGAPGIAGGQCSNISCHGGQTTPAWSTGSINVGTACTSCHKLEDPATEYNSASTGMHAITTGISSKNHGADYNCSACHSAPPSNHFAGLDTTAMDTVDNMVGGITIGATPDQTTCAMTCHLEKTTAGRSANTAWARLNDKAKASSGSCDTCHGVFNSFVSGFSPSHVVAGLTDTANHGVCKTCHGFTEGDSDASYSTTWGTGNHGNASITMNGPDSTPGPAAGAGYADDTWNCTNTCHSLTGAETEANARALADSGWPVEYGDFGAGSCDGCHGPGGSGPTVVWPSANSGFAGDQYGAHLRWTAGETLTSAGGNNGARSWNDQCLGCHGFHSGEAPLIANNDIVGINYSSHSGIYIGGTATTATTEAEICWECHDSQGVSEWGTDDGGNNFTSQFANNYDFGNMTGGGSSWYGEWNSGAGFGYKSGQIQSTHSASSAGSSALATTGLNNSTENRDAVTNIRCSYCHDVHNTAGHSSNPAGQLAGDVDGKPYLRGSWRNNPYNEDGAPQSGADFTAASGAYNNVPRAVATAAQVSGGTEGGYWIDQNTDHNGAGNDTNTDGYLDWTPTEMAGLCFACHMTGTAAISDKINDMDELTSDTAAIWLGTNGNGHANSVLGGDPTTTTNEFNVFGVRGTATDTDNNPRQSYDGIGARPADTGSIGDGFRSPNPEGFPDYWASQTGNSVPNWPQITGVGTRPSGYPADQWGVNRDGSLTQEKYHQFSCSKCHNPHASRLPKLMITNCLDTKHNTWDNQYDLNPAETLDNNDAYTGTASANQNKAISNWSNAQNCHRLGGIQATNGRSGYDSRADEAGVGAGWNNVTPWD